MHCVGGRVHPRMESCDIRAGAATLICKEQYTTSTFTVGSWSTLKRLTALEEPCSIRQEVCLAQHPVSLSGQVGTPKKPHKLGMKVLVFSKHLILCGSLPLYICELYFYISWILRIKGTHTPC